MASSNNANEGFPPLDPSGDAPQSTQPTQLAPTTKAAPNSPSKTRSSRASSTASAVGRMRSASLKLMDAAPPSGMWSATGSVASKAPTLSDLRTGSFNSQGWDEETQRYKAERRGSQSDEGSGRLSRQGSWKTPTTPTDRSGFGMPERKSSNNLRTMGAVTEEDPTRPSFDISARPPVPTEQEKEMGANGHWKRSLDAETHEDSTREPQVVSQYANGYIPPPKVPWKKSTVIGLKAFWKWFLTIPGFLITLYCLNVVAWGGMLFLLLCNAAPAMCKPDCNHINSPRRIWIEIDSQILNALFCVTGFGLAPWRFYSLYFWAWWRIGGSKRRTPGIRKLAGIYRGWFRLPGSEQLGEHDNAKSVDPANPAVPVPVAKIPDPPPTGIRAPPTKGWKLDFVIWMNVMNTFLQVVLCFYMWHYNRHTRPSWATGLFVALACIVAGAAGIMEFVEGKAVKKVEGVPVPKEYEDRRVDVEGQHSEQHEPLVSDAPTRTVTAAANSKS